ncbi:aminodeoxychorismate synthase [Trichoderma asperellum]|uniref:aminodeoxychorismate synthase n=1 Tax=Trichoderma asperellum TaxID=101201 RepID=A0A6V8QYK9_TRIAP|nr:ADC synthase [Trichoderma asperelloides]GFP55463.1 aminodeoxychorismate synthase [Trichoderma asperellum]
MPLLESQSGPSPPAVANSRSRRILFLDAYDSFTNNIVSLLKEALGDDVLVHVLHMDLKTLHADPSPDWTPEDFVARLPCFDAVVCGPGPGSPLCEADVGAFRLLWELPRDKAVPVLGICLGFQSLVAQFGGGIRKLRRGLHGMVRRIEHRDGDIFANVPEFRATLYHSLCADVGQDVISPERWETDMWLSPKGAPDLVPLAWTVEEYEDGAAEPERILMGVRHAKLPFWGVQYHPESICTDTAAHGVLKNWFSQALKWNESTGREMLPVDSEHIADSFAPSMIVERSIAAESRVATQKWWRDMQSGLAVSRSAPVYSCRRITLPDGVDAADVAEFLGVGGADSIMLDSSSTISGDPLARSSIIALEVDQALRFEYHVGDSWVTLRQPGTRDQEEVCQRIEIDSSDEHGAYDVWNVISEFWQQRKVAEEGGQEPAFKGGFMGFVTYEMGLSSLSPESISKNRGHHRPDLCFAWISKSLVLDHQAGVAYVQTLTPTPAESWIDDVVAKLQTSRAWQQPGYGSEEYKSIAAKRQPNEALLKSIQEPTGRLRFKTPKPAKYDDDVRQCQDAIAEGQSYELCLTAQTTMTRPRGNDVPRHLQQPAVTNGSSNGVSASSSSWPADEASRHGTPWQIYRTLRARQPAPFGSFIRLAGATILSSSPERFLAHDAQGLCSMRPMKGTVRKSEAVSTLAQAEKLLHIPKEEAENLMIVDLVRHDLYGVCGARRVTVPDLLKVEEYSSVFQMITVVNGQLPSYHNKNTSTSTSTKSVPNGLDVLAAALPPGSMTGAPKKRSCEILHTIEPTERSIYSGVVGFLDARGQGDWSVTIRTMFRWDDERAPPLEGEEETQPREVWRIGAGGAVTILSTPEGETEEMFTKLCGPLGVFKDAA